MATITSSWTTEQEQEVEPLLPGERRTVTLQSAELTTKDGYRHPQGVYRVLVNGRVYSYTTGYKLKGETAWMNGERLYRDIVAKIAYGR